MQQSHPRGRYWEQHWYPSTKRKQKQKAGGQSPREHPIYLLRDPRGGTVTASMDVQHYWRQEGYINAWRHVAILVLALCITLVTSHVVDLLLLDTSSADRNTFHDHIYESDSDKALMAALIEQHMWSTLGGHAGTAALLEAQGARETYQRAFLDAWYVFKQAPSGIGTESEKSEAFLRQRSCRPEQNGDRNGKTSIHSSNTHYHYRHHHHHHHHNHYHQHDHVFLHAEIRHAARLDAYILAFPVIPGQTRLVCAHHMMIEEKQGAEREREDSLLQLCHLQDNHQLDLVLHGDERISPTSDSTRAFVRETRRLPCLHEDVQHRYTRVHVTGNGGHIGAGAGSLLIYECVLSGAPAYLLQLMQDEFALLSANNNNNN